MSGRVIELAVRRSEPEDARHVTANLIGENAFSYKTRHGDSLSIHELIQKDFMCITAYDAGSPSERIVGFAAFNDIPSTTPGLPSNHWEEFVKCGWLLEKDLIDVHPSNTVWLTCIAIADDVGGTNEAYEIASKILSTALATLLDINNFLMALPDSAVPFSPVCDLLFRAIDLSGKHVPESNRVFHEESTFKGNVYKLTRSELIPELILRPGVVEDFDDLRPLLVAGLGVVTPIPEGFYLEELLQEQNEHNAVVVAQDRNNGKVVGLMCLKATYDEQQYAVREYTTDIFGKLKPIFPQTQHKGQAALHNVVRIAFFFLDPEYDNRAYQFLPYIFNKFLFAEYTLIYLPHAAPVHPLLHSFAYVPIKRIKGGGAQPEHSQLPEGLYLCCRYTLESVAVAPASSAHESAVHKMMSTQAELSHDLSEIIGHSFTQSIPVVRSQEQEPQQMPYVSFAITWRESVVGVVVCTRCTTEEVFALRANFDVDQFVDFNPKGDTNFNACDISEDPYVAPSTYYRAEMPALVVRHCYIKPVFRTRLRLVLREVLRWSGAELLFHVAGTDTEIFPPLMAELVLCPPRRVVEFCTEEPQLAQSQDVDGLMCLHHTSRKSLSDEKTQINARIVVVGAGTTGLAFIYSLLTIPYLYFSNILLISRDGLPNHAQQRELHWTADTMDWTEREYLALKVGKKIRVIEGGMMDFDFGLKCIYTDTPSCEPYDHLILTTGTQYTMPKDLPKHNGVFPLTNETQIQKIKTHVHESEIYEDERSRTVIYGSSLDVFAIAQSVIKLGLAPQRLVLVSPEDPTFTPFGDREITNRIDTMFEAMGIVQHRGYEIQRLDYDEDNALNMVVIAPSTPEGQTDAAKAILSNTSGVKVIDIDATMLICANDKDIDEQVLIALNKRSIVFDGRVIVENSYRTTNKFIYAAGPVAMFSKRFGPSHDFDIYSALEVGRHLGAVILGFLGIDEFVDPELLIDERDYVPKDNPLAAALGHEQLPDEAISRKRPKPLPVYADNICRRVTLPGGLTYFSCETVEYPELAPQCLHLSSVANEGAAIRNDKGKQDAFAVDGDDGSYVRISLGPSRRIERVVYLGRETRELYNLRSLVGTMESNLNLLYNYQETKNLDILSYMRQTWARAAFHDKFQMLMKKIKKRLAAHPEVIRVREEVLNKLKEQATEHVSEADRKSALLQVADDHAEARRIVELELIKFLHENKAFMPQHYFLPSIQAAMQAEE